MREIKFRLWIDGQKRMEYDSSVSYIFDLFCEPEDTVLQYINKDSTGQDIFEGDIIVHSSNNEQHPTPVRFYDGAFRIDTPLGTVIDDWYASHSRVIGNIYQNPNLLQKGGN